MLSASRIAELHDLRTAQWHRSPPSPAVTEVAPPDAPADEFNETAWMAAVQLQHQANFELWHIEDEARVPNAGDARLADVKRRVDRTNQRRNDLAEALDRLLLAYLHRLSLPVDEAPLHSESPGLIVDRLSILSLKIWHTREETVRADAPAGHAERNRRRLLILEEQRADLAACLDALWTATLAGERRFKLYRQLKMYNDPSLNPSVYGQNRALPARG